MKKKNTGNEQSNQGHRAKMNSSDRFGLEQVDAEGWTPALGKRSRRKLRKDQKQQEQESAKKDSLSRRRAHRSRRSEVSPPTPPPRNEEDLSDKDSISEENFDAQRSDLSDSAQSESEVERDDSAPAGVVPETPPPVQAQAYKVKKSVKVAKVNAADGLTLEEMLDDIVKNGERHTARH